MKPKLERKKKKAVAVAVSGGFDPLHVGHVRLFKAAKKLGDRLIVILNNEHWLKKKKGFVFMPDRERAEILRAVAGVDRVMMTSHGPDPKDMSVSRELKKLRPDVFANGGDRFSENTPEVAVCREIGCAMVFCVGRGGKVQSSSQLIAALLKEKRVMCGGSPPY